MLVPTYTEVHDACYDLKKFFERYEFKFNRVIGISRGGLFPGLIISHMLNLPFTPVSYSSEAGKGNDKDHSNILPPISEYLALLVDDICDSGNTLSDVKSYYELQGASIYTFVLFYKSHTVPLIIPDFKWRTIPENADWVNFPWEKNEL